MGCALCREASSRSVDSEANKEKKEKGNEEEEEKEDLRVESGRRLDVAVARVDSSIEVHNGGTQEGRQDGSQPARGDRRRLRSNSRPRNLPKHRRGEQVAAGWPSWLAAVAGEAINGWIPRRADSFEKIDKVGFYFYFLYKNVHLE